MLGRCLRLTRQCRHYSAATEQKRVIFSGIQPTGIPHLGNYLGALKNWVALQSSVQPTMSTIYYCIVDLHAITVPYECDVLRREREEMWYILYAVGIDMQRCTVFEQSAVKRHPCECNVLGP
jgi:tryptophanyl-tRNA synthetase